jgi:hypothetical protein
LSLKTLLPELGQQFFFSKKILPTPIRIKRSTVHPSGTASQGKRSAVSGFPGDRKCDSTFQFGNSKFFGLSLRHGLYSTALGTVSKRFLAEFLPAMEKKIEVSLKMLSLLKSLFHN